MSINFPNLPPAILAYRNKGSTQADLARRLHVSRATVTLWIQGGDPEAAKLHDLALALGVSIAYLAGEDGAVRTPHEAAVLAEYRNDPLLRAMVDAALDFRKGKGSNAA